MRTRTCFRRHVQRKPQSFFDIGAAACVYLFFCIFQGVFDIGPGGLKEPVFIRAGLGRKGDDVEIVNIPFETTKLVMDEEKPVKEGWIDFFEDYKPYLKYGFLCLFLMLSFLFFVRPLVRWLTEYSISDKEMFKQLPKTVGELESEYDQAAKRLTFRDQASQLIASDSKASMDVMRDWIKDESQ